MSAHACSHWEVCVCMCVCNKNNRLQYDNSYNNNGNNTNTAKHLTGQRHRTGQLEAHLANLVAGIWRLAMLFGSSGQYYGIWLRALPLSPLKLCTCTCTHLCRHNHITCKAAGG